MLVLALEGRGVRDTHGEGKGLDEVAGAMGEAVAAGFMVAVMRPVVLLP